MQKIGILREIMRYPVKSMMGEKKKQIFINYAGLMGDRAYACVDLDKQGNFPWLTARELPELLLYRPQYKQEIPTTVAYPSKEQFQLVVQTPSQQAFDIEAAELLSELASKSGRKIALRFSEAGMQDARPVSLVSSQTISHLEEQLQLSLHPHRFRMNFYIEWLTEGAYFEDELVGKQIQIGETFIASINKKDFRCVIPTIDPTSLAKTPAIMGYISQYLSGCFGVYAVVIREGVVEEGHPIYLMDT